MMNEQLPLLMASPRYQEVVVPNNYKCAHRHNGQSLRFCISYCSIIDDKNSRTTDITGHSKELFFSVFRKMAQIKVADIHDIAHYHFIPFNLSFEQSDDMNENKFPPTTFSVGPKYQISLTFWVVTEMKPANGQTDTTSPLRIHFMCLVQKTYKNECSHCHNPVQKPFCFYISMVT
jgi:hypothetical protein